MISKKFVSSVLVGVTLSSTLLTGVSFADETSLKSEKDVQTFVSKQKLADSVMDQVLKEVNLEIKEGKEDIHISRYVSDLGQKVSVDFKVNDLNNSSDKVSLYSASKPSGTKEYSGSVNAWGFTHQLRGQFTYGSGKVKTATKEALASGLAFSHTRPSHISKLDPSVWAVQSTSKHKWLGTVGKYTGLGYTSYITINLYGSGNSKLMKATYKTGI